MSTDVKCRKWILKSHFSGLPKREDLEIVEEQLPQLKDGGTACAWLGYVCIAVEWLIDLSTTEFKA